MDIEVSSAHQFKVGATSVAKFTVSNINFLGYADCVTERKKEAVRTGSDVMAEKVFRHMRRVKQVTAFDKSGNIVPLDRMNFATIPRPLFIKINKAIDNFAEPRGEVITQNGDGVLTPIVYKLGTPFEFDDVNANRKAIGTKQQIIELEFIAKTGGDIEEVLCYDAPIEQTIALIKTCATPIGGGDTGLLRLPSTMIDVLTLADGFDILSKVLPLFTE